MIESRELSQGWEYTEAGQNAWAQATVPGCVQLDLLDAGTLPDPNYRMDEYAMQSVEDKDWEYRTSFQVGADELVADEIDLVFEGLDTYADVYVNETYLGSVANMFVSHTFDITEVVREGANDLHLYFHSPVTTIKTLERNSPLSLTSSCETARPYIRKAQYAYGWDWGPRLVQVGIWRPVRLDVIRHARIVDPYVRTISLDGGTATVQVEGQVDAFIDASLQVRASVSLETVPCASVTAPVAFGPTGLTFGTEFALPDAQLWWPNGLGEHPLYDVAIELLDGERVIDSALVRFGVRTVELVQKDDAAGKSFCFKINGVPIFAKGANWIPSDNLLPRLTPTDYQELISAAAEANINMLRIWGGGIYELPAFYQACDEQGIMVWQDFMYACAQYPDEMDWFQDAARTEAERVVRRLRNHPSIVLWCGNNENNWGFDEWWHVGQPKFLGNYVYREILPTVCGELDPSRPYWVSSPYGGEHPNCEEEGDRHQWSVWSAWQDYGHYVEDRGRFVSEFGFQAMPAWKTVLSYTAPEDRTILSPVIRNHNKMPEGTERLVRFLAGRIGLPRDLKSFTYLTQLNQAEAVKTGVEHWRSNKFHTSGALFWQLNDCWPVASWSCLDYYKRRKGLFHYARRFNAPILPLLRYSDDRIMLSCVSDHMDETRAQARISAYALDGTLRAEVTFPVAILPNAVTPLRTLSLEDLGIGNSPRIVPVERVGTSVPEERNGALLDTVLFVEITTDAGQRYRNYLLFDRFRDLRLQNPRIVSTVDGKDITVEVGAPAFGVFVETENDVHLSDNCLWIEPHKAVTVHCSADPGSVSIVSLVDLVQDI